MVPEGPFMDLLQQNTEDALSYFESIPEDRHTYRYAEDKWTVLQVLMHIIDVERIMSYRALVAARGDNKTPLLPMDDHGYMANSNAESRTMASLLSEFKAVRAATQSLFATITDEQSIFHADNGGYGITARALGYIIMGHLLHHMSVVEQKYA